MANIDYFYRSEEFDVRFLEFLDNRKKDGKLTGVGKFIEYINAPRFTVKSTESSYRVIGSWIELGLVDIKTKELKWKKFSIADIIWIRLINELRNFGVSLSLIKEAKKWLFLEYYLTVKENPEWKFTDNQAYLFEYYVLLALSKKAVNFVFFPNGQAFLATPEQLSFNIEYLGLRRFIQINFSDLVKEVFGKKDLKTEYSRSVTLSIEESEIIDKLRSGNISNLEIKLKNGKIERIEISEPIDPNTEISELLKDGDFQDITIKQKEGKVVSVKQTIKKKV
jgi:hypothetical protein